MSFVVNMDSVITVAMLVWRMNAFRVLVRRNAVLLAFCVFFFKKKTFVCFTKATVNRLMTVQCATKPKVVFIVKTDVAVKFRTVKTEWHNHGQCFVYIN